MINAKSVHIIGIGGIGTSAVAKLFLASGAKVSGSDVHQSQIIDDLSSRGVTVKIGHFADNVPGDCDLVIYSNAVPSTNVERQVASERGLTEWAYPKFLGKLAAEHRTVAVSGTNGKSTTAAMIAKILIEADYDPTVIIGTQSPDLPDGNLRVGKGKWLVLEACEHMASMLNIKPEVAVITNIEEDHLDFYRDLNHIRETFQKWIESCDQVIVNAIDPESQKLQVERKQTFAIKNRLPSEQGQIFEVIGQGFKPFNQKVILSIPGEFNAQNAAAAAATAQVIGIDDQTIKDALANFKGSWRRFEKVGRWHEADLYSDYAHHPTAVQGSLKAFREFFPGKRLVVVFEPHQFSRTHELFDGFVQSFDEADVLIISEVYEVEGRNENQQETSRDLVEKIKARGKINHVLYAADVEKAESKLRDVVKAGDVIVVMGAGTIDELARRLA